MLKENEEKRMGFLQQRQSQQENAEWMNEANEDSWTKVR